MRVALAILAIMALIIMAALNASALIDSVISLATGPLFSRESAWIGWLLILLAVAVVVIVVAARKGSRLADEDPDIGGIGATDFETAHRTNDRN